MSTSLLYHAFGIRGYEYVRTDYRGGATIFTIRQDPDGCRCSACGPPRAIPPRPAGRQFLTLPIGSRKTTVALPIPRLECQACGRGRQGGYPLPPRGGGDGRASWAGEGRAGGGHHDAGQADQRVDDAARRRRLAPEQGRDEVELEEADQAPVDGPHDHQEQRDPVERSHAVIPFWYLDFIGFWDRGGWPPPRPRTRRPGPALTPPAGGAR